MIIFRGSIVKKILLLSGLFLSFSAFCDSEQIKIEKSEMRTQGQNLVNGGVDALFDRLNDPSAKKEISGATQNAIDGAFGGAKESFKKGGEFDQLTEEFGQSAKRNTDIVTKDISSSMKVGAANLSEGLQDISKKDGELDKAFTSWRGLVEEHVNGLADDLGHRNLIKGGGIALCIVGGYFALKYGIPLAYKMIERRLTRPKLIIESSKKSLVQRFKSLFTSVKQSLEMVFSPALKEQLSNIVKVTRVINSKIKQGFTNIKYRNLMLYGPPGTGKTMFAKELAKRCGLEYVFMSGSSFSKFKDGEGIEALDELFAWAKRSKGLLIFIDEAETFLSKRENMDPQSKAYQLLNNFLNYTGDRSSQFMIVFATNHKDALDSAMYRRIDDLIEMPLPSKEQRVGTLKLYINKILMDVKQNGKVFVDSVVQYFDGQMIDDIAQKTKGLSYGDLEGIINTIKTDSDILDPSVVSVALINTVVERAVKKHQAFTQGQPLGFVED